MTHVPLVDPAVSPGYLLRVAQQVHTTAWSQLVRAVTGPQYAVLVAIATWPGIDQKTAGERASLDKATMAGVVNRLEKRGWIIRQRDPDDGRRRLVLLSESALAQLPTLTASAGEVQNFLLEVLEACRLAPFINALAAVAHADDLPPRSAASGPPVLEMARTPGYLLRRAQQLHTTLWSELVEEITGPQYAVLSAVANHGVATHTEIGAKASLDTSTTHAIVRRLITRGWLRQVEGVTDRRSRPVTLTDDGELVLTVEVSAVADVQKLLLQPLPHDARKNFIADLASVARLS